MSAQHGTITGWNAHKRRGEKPCDACYTAWNVYAAWRRFRLGNQHHPRSCHQCGSVFPAHACTMAAPA